MAIIKVFTFLGMLLAGQLYIQFASEDAFNEKLAELHTNLGKFITTHAVSKVSLARPPRIFLSYCWSNSLAAKDAGQIGRLTGHEFSDPRRIKKGIESGLGEDVWLDIEQVGQFSQSMGDSLFRER